MWNDKRYYSIDYYLKQTFGEKVYRLALNGGMTCPKRDGTLGRIRYGVFADGDVSPAGKIVRRCFKRPDDFAVDRRSGFPYA